MALQVIFRLDDICEEMNRERFLRIKEIFDRYGIKPLIGVVPQNEDPFLRAGNRIPGFWEMIRTLQAQGWTVAQHGYRHVYMPAAAGRGRLFAGGQSEFAGLPYEKQLEKIRMGKEILTEHGIQTDVFFAPSHSFDDNTLKALGACGFKYVSDGLTNRPYRYRGLTFVPCKEDKIKLKRRFSCVCYHTNDMDEARFGETELFLSKMSACTLTFEQAAQLRPQPYLSARLYEILYMGFYTYIFAAPYHIYYRLFRNGKIGKLRNAMVKRLFEKRLG